MQKLILLSTIVFFSGLSARNLQAEVMMAKDPIEHDKFQFPNPNTNDLGKQLNLWATYYYTQELKNPTGDTPLRNKNGEILGPTMSRKAWCSVALEGSVRILNTNEVAQTFNYAGTTADHAVNCKDLFKFDVSKTKFHLAHGPWGDGLPDKYILAPYRTIATDLNYLVPGTVIFIPKARGTKIKLPNGNEIIHDGYFFAGDKGGAIKGSHIDVFIGIDQDAPYFSWIKSSSSGTFVAYVVKDQKIIAELQELHAQ